MDMQFIGQEVVPDDRIQDRIDILAFDSNDNIPVVIELKRRKSKFQPLQGIAYAAMISNWDQERFIGEAKRQKSPDLEDLENDLCDEDLKGKVRVVLVAEKFDPEVIIGADYLHKQFKMDILAFSFKNF